MEPSPVIAQPLPGPVVIPSSALDQLLDAIRRRGFRLVGRQEGRRDLLRRHRLGGRPAGRWTDVQDAASYRLARRDDDALFGYNVGPHSWKKYLFTPYARLSPPEPPPDQPFAFIGVRSCELAAIAIQDRVFLGGQSRRTVDYRDRRENAFIVAVNCAEAGGHLLLRLDGHRTAGRVGLRPRADRAASATAITASSRRRAASAAPRRCATAAAPAPRRPGPASARRGAAPAPAASDGPRCRHRPAGAADASDDAPALGRRRGSAA